jgi:uncharacterized protein involved in response to NO
MNRDFYTIGNFTMHTDTDTTITSSDHKPHQQPFARVAPLLRTALLSGSGGGFVLATILTLTAAFAVSIGPWWSATAQAHGHLQLYGWAGLFMLGVAFHFLPRLRGAPLAASWLVPWILGILVTGLLLRTLSQPLFAATGAAIWAVLLVASGVLECAALVGAVWLLSMTALQGPSLATRPALKGVLPFFVGAFIMLALASVVNLINMLVATTAAGLVPEPIDNLNVTLGLFGYLVPVALAMSAQTLPMYAGLEAFPRRILWPMAGFYFTGIVLTAFGSQPTPLSGMLTGLGMLLMGLVLLTFTIVFIRMIVIRGRLPRKVTQLAPSPEAAAQAYKKKIRAARGDYGPFVALVASAYLWALFAAVLLVVDGLTLLFAGTPFFSIDAIRHGLAIGFITLLICGIAPRMIPGFSGKKIASPALVNATLWLGNTTVLLRAGSILLAPFLVTINIVGVSLYAILFGLSGPMGLALAICLSVNLWPAL